MVRKIDGQVEILRQAGYRVTRSRLAVMRVLSLASETLDVSSIHQLGSEIHPKLGRVSVYRALDLLVRLGLARRVHGPNGCHGYARADRDEGHYLICHHCGRVSEFPCVGLDRFLKSIGDQFGFVIQHHLLQLEGLCMDCRDLRQVPYSLEMSESIDGVSV